MSEDEGEEGQREGDEHVDTEPDGSEGDESRLRLCDEGEVFVGDRRLSKHICMYIQQHPLQPLNPRSKTNTG